MYIYNVSTKVDFGIEESWKKWMQEVHIPKVMNTSCFVKYQFAKMLDNNDDEGIVYAISYYVADLDKFEEYLEKYANELRSETINQWGDKIIAFRSLLEVFE